MQQHEASNIAERLCSEMRDVLLFPKNTTEGLALCTQIDTDLRKKAVRCFHTDDTKRFLPESLPGNARAGRSTVYIFSDDSALFFGDTWRDGKWTGPVLGMWRKPPSKHIVPIEEAPKGSPLLIEEESNQDGSSPKSGTEKASAAEYQIELNVHCVHRVRASSDDEVYKLAVQLTCETSQHMPQMQFMVPYHLGRDTGVGLTSIKRTDGSDLIAGPEEQEDLK